MRIDHILLGAADLDAAVDHFERVTGVRPAYGGKHPAGTHNALVSLGAGLYLELLAPQPGKIPTGYREFLSASEAPTPVGWAVATDDLGALRARLVGAGFSPTEPEAGSRVTPTGETLRWKMCGLESAPAGAPFLIEWGDSSPHPSSMAPPGCRLERWVVESPDHESLQRLATELGLGVSLDRAANVALHLVLSCPQGLVSFASGSKPAS